MQNCVTIAVPRMTTKPTMQKILTARRSMEEIIPPTLTATTGPNIGAKDIFQQRRSPPLVHSKFAKILFGSTGNAFPTNFGLVFRQTNQSSTADRSVGNHKGIVMVVYQEGT